MTIKIKFKHVLYVVNGIVWIKYGVITDLLRFTRHSVNTVTDVVNSVGQGVNDVIDGAGSTVGNIQYNAASIAAGDKDMLQLIICAVIVLIVLFRFGPTIINFLSYMRGVNDAKLSKYGTKTNRTGTKTNRTGTKTNRTGTKTNRTGTKKETKTDAWKKWYSDYGANYKTKKDAKKHFDEWYMWEHEISD